MKKIFTFLLLFIIAASIYAQAPEGIIYQAEARDNSGIIIENESLDVRIIILEDDVDGQIVWEGLHNVTTNKYGMFVLVIGTGTNNYGYNFDEISWGKNAHFLNVGVKTSGAFDWIDMGTTQFLSVPYALHAKTAESLVLEETSILKGATPGVPSQTWSLFGNSKTDSEKDKIGTTDAADLVFITDNIERLRITKAGKLITADGVGLELGGNLQVHGDSTYIDKDFYVGRNVYLNVNDEFNPRGETFNFGNFSVENNSTTLLTGTLTVDGETDLNSDFRVNNGSSTRLSGDLNVDGETDLNSDLRVNNASATGLSGTLTVDGITNLNSALNVNNQRPTYLTGVLTVENKVDLKTTLNVDGKAEFNEEVVVKNNVADGTYLATFENTNNETGDGIKIKLGKKATKNGSGFDVIDQGLSAFVLQGWRPDKFSSVKNLFDGNVDAGDAQFLGEMLVPDPADALAVAASLCILSEQLTDLIFTELNSILAPVQFPTITLPAMCMDLPLEIGEVCVPGLSSPTTLFNGFDLIPDLPTGNSLDFSCDVLGSGFQFPVLNFADQSNILDGDNTFIVFTDNTDWTMGAIKAQSIDEWAAQYLDPVFLYDLYSTFKGLDKSSIFPEMRAKAKEVAEAYLEIGVEYSSGNGDYAEWLERLDPVESIGTGDIVAVKGGKITKDLTNAEQVMAISHRPIILGNIPKEGKSYLGNNVAFMGQIPVKIMGVVHSGDFIVGNNEIAGYGKAISPNDMTIEDFKLVVGRSWDADLNEGPKMVNTVVGVHNGNYLNILKSYEQKFRESEERLESVEAKIDQLSTLLIQAEK